MNRIKLSNTGIAFVSDFGRAGKTPYTFGRRLVTIAALLKNHIPISTMAASKVGSAILSPREKIHVRALELAVLAGRCSDEITQSDYEQAKRDVTGEVDRDRQNSVLNANHTPVVQKQRSAIKMPNNSTY